MITVLAHNIRSMHNIGSIFRTCDGAGISKLYLTGYTACPPRKEINKTALGADESVVWEYHKDPIKLVKKLKKEGLKIIALERTEGSIDITTFKSKPPLCMIIGNEIDGVEPDLIKLSDAIVEIPMRGQKESLNVSVAFGIAAYFLT
ncbi:RNA methyltransferase [Candidatus Peregrinibacteria bacterium CG_4_10_14_0_2_um_filter_43_11]|nr:MAG: RNA methyltransferase [Candidatus Peregrinibacteria bacterium CG_4_10_14_0_2_um_filter_43_11]